MSKEIDEKVVRMRFDNAEFEKKINATIKSLKSLEDSLKLEDASEGLENVQNASKKIKMDKLGKDVGKVTAKFSALSIVAATALNRITNFAINTGVALTKSLTIDNISSGWSKYENQLVTVGGIVNNVRQNFDSLVETNAAVAGSMATLLTYADETSFSFSSMSDGIRQFTTAGVELEKATSAAIGVTSLAGASKVFDKYKVQSAMNAISKSMQQGYVSLEKWTTLSQTSGIVTTEFSQALMDAAVEEGTLVKNLNGVYATTKTGQKVTSENIASTLKAKWLTSDVITKTLARYSSAYETLGKYADETGVTISEALDEIYDGDKILLSSEEQLKKYGVLLDELGLKALKSSQETSTFSQAIEATREAVGTQFQVMFQTLLGDTEEARELWSEVSNVLYYTFVPALSSVNEMLDEWKSSGGFAILSEGLINFFNIIRMVVEEIQNAFADVFGKTTLDGFSTFVEGFRDFTQRAKENKTLFETIGLIFKSLFLVFKTFGSVFKSGLKLFGSLLKLLTPLIEILSEAVSYLADGLDAFSNWVEIITSNNRVFNNFKLMLQDIWQVLKRLFASLKESSIYRTFSKFADKVITFFKSLKTLSPREALLSIVLMLQSGLNKIKDWIDDTINTIQNGFIRIKNLLINWLEKSGLMPILKKFWNGLKSLWDKILSFIKSIPETIKSAYDPEKSAWANFLDILKAIIDKAKAVGVVFLLFSLAKLFKTVGWVMESITSFLESKKLNAISRILLSFAAGIAALAAALYVIGKMNSEKMIKSVVAAISMTAALAGIMFGLAVLLKKYGLSDKRWVSGLLRTFIGMSTILIVAVELLNKVSKVSFTDIGKMVALVGGLGLAIAAFKVIANKTGKAISFFGILKIVTLLQIIYKNIDKLNEIVAKIDLAKMEKTIKVMAYLSVIVIAFSALLGVVSTLQNIRSGGKTVNVIKTAFSSMDLIATVIVIYFSSKALKSIYEKLKEMLTPKQIMSIGIMTSSVIVAFGIASFLINKSSKVLQKGQHLSAGLSVSLSILAIVYSLKLIFEAIKTANEFDLKAYTKGIHNIGVILLSLIGLIAILTVASKINNKGGSINSVLVSIGIILAVLAVILFIPEEEIKRGLKILGAIGAFVGVLFTILAIFTRKSGFRVNFDSIYKTMLMFSIVLAIMVGTIIYFGKTGIDKKTWEAFGLIAAIVGLIVGAIIALSLLTKRSSDVANVYRLLIPLTLMFTVLGALLITIAEMQNSGYSFKSALGVLAGIVGLVSLMMIVISYSTKLADRTYLSTMTTLIVLVTVLVIGFTHVIKNIAKNGGVTKDMWKAYGLIAAIVGLVLLVVTVTALVSKLYKDNMAGAILGIVSIIAIAVAIVGVIHALKSLEDVDVDELNSVVSGIIKLFVVIGLLIGVLVGISSTGVGGAGIALAAVAIVVIAAAIWLIADALRVAADALDDLLPTLKQMPEAVDALVKSLMTLFAFGAVSGLATFSVIPLCSKLTALYAAILPIFKMTKKYDGYQAMFDSLTNFFQTLFDISGQFAENPDLVNNFIDSIQRLLDELSDMKVFEIRLQPVIDTSVLAAQVAALNTAISYDLANGIANGIRDAAGIINNNNTTNNTTYGPTYNTITISGQSQSTVKELERALNELNAKKTSSSYKKIIGI